VNLHKNTGVNVKVYLSTENGIVVDLFFS